MTRILTIIALLFATPMLAGCVSHQAQIYGSVEIDNKTITVPSGNSGLKGKIKAALSKQGWKMVVLSGPELTRGTIGSQINIEKQKTQLTRYSLRLSYNQYDWCLNLQRAIYYDISLIDNESGAEIFTLGGNGCSNTVAKKFSENLEKITSSP